jgi:hypothetical protein
MRENEKSPDLLWIKNIANTVRKKELSAVERRGRSVKSMMRVLVLTLLFTLIPINVSIFGTVITNYKEAMASMPVDSCNGTLMDYVEWYSDGENIAKDQNTPLTVGSSDNINTAFKFSINIPEGATNIQATLAIEVVGVDNQSGTTADPKIFFRASTDDNWVNDSIATHPYPADNSYPNSLFDKVYTINDIGTSSIDVSSAFTNNTYYINGTVNYHICFNRK